MNWPAQGGPTFDTSGNLWAAEGDAPTGRLLEFKPSFKDGMAASLVIGSIYPSALSFDSSGNLWRGFWGWDAHAGVFEFKPPFGDHMKAFTGLGGYPGPYWSQTISAPTGLTFDSTGNLWVAECETCWLVNWVGRVLGFDV